MSAILLRFYCLETVCVLEATAARRRAGMGQPEAVLCCWLSLAATDRTGQDSPSHGDDRTLQPT